MVVVLTVEVPRNYRTSSRGATYQLVGKLPGITEEVDDRKTILPGDGVRPEC